MPRYFILLLSFGCSDYEVSPIEREEEKSWFEEASESYQDDFDPDARPEDDGDDVQAGEQEEVEEDTGTWEWPADDGDEEDANPVPAPDDEDDEPPSDDAPPPETDSGPDDGSHDDPPPSDEGGPESGAPSGGSASASVPASGEIVITELMIHPQATDDAQGEWVEIHNPTSGWLDLTGSMLVDRGVDAVEIEPVSLGSLIVEPGGYLTLCAEPDYWDNGGVSCDGTFYYWTLGGGFALSNTEDEVKLISSTGSLLDEVRYTEGFSVEGEALALDPDNLSVAANDLMGNWCEQYTLLPFGDGGTPGEPNDNCF